MLKPRVLILSLLACLALGVAACGSDDSASTTSDQPAPAATNASTGEATTSTEAAAPAKLPTVSKDTSKKPTISDTSGDPPTELQKVDVVKGHGKTAKSGDTVSVQYVGRNWSSNKQFDASWDRGQAFSFPLGQGQVIQGWDEGVAGMKVGGRRLLVIPPDLGYGPQGTPDGSIPPNETLVFVVDLKKVG